MTSPSASGPCSGFENVAKRAAGFLIFRRLCGQIQYLLLQTSYGKHHWTPPKGHVDPGEDDYTTALRETREEAGYSEDDLKIFKNLSYTLNYKVEDSPKVVVYWLAELKNPEKEPILSEEHQDLKWLPKVEAQDLSGFQDFRKMVDHFHEKVEANELE